MDIFEDIDYYNNLFNVGSFAIDIPSRYLRDRQDPYAMDIDQFKMRYRFSQDAVKNFILPLVSAGLQKSDRRGEPLAPELQILVCLRFYATASYQIVCGDLLHVSQPAVSNIVRIVSLLLAQKHREFIKYPNSTQLMAHRTEFANLGKYNHYPGLRNIEGAIDCTHIKIVDTPGVQHHEVYRNRKSYFSINVQAVVGPTGEFMDLVSRWAGSTHDSRIFQMSKLNMKYIQGFHDGKLVGDSGYPCLPYLMTPVNSPSSRSEEIYNKVQAKTRSIVERTFGQWKRRFPCLRRGLGNKLSTVSNIIVACAVLFNIARMMNGTVENTEEATEPEEVSDPEESANGGSADGFAIRQHIINSYDY